MMSNRQTQQAACQTGFTLVELIMIMVLIGILAAVALPRFADRNVYDSRGFADETVAILRFAQKTAIAQRRNVCVIFSSNSVTLTIATADPMLGPSTCSGTSVVPLAGPTGAAPYKITAKPGVAYSTVPTNFQFYALGNASVTQTIQVQGVSNTITVEGASGYVRS